MDWFFANGMPSLFPHHSSAEALSQTVQEPEGDVGDLGYVSDAVIQARVRFRFLHNTAKGINMVKTPGQKAYGLQLLQVSRDTLRDIGHIALFRAMVENAGLPPDLSAIDISDDHPDQFPIDPEVHVPSSTNDDVMAGIYTSLQSIIIEGRPLGDDASPSTGVPVRRQTRAPNRFSHSRYNNPRGREE